MDNFYNPKVSFLDGSSVKLPKDTVNLLDIKVAVANHVGRYVSEITIIDRSNGAILDNGKVGNSGLSLGPTAELFFLDKYKRSIEEQPVVEENNNDDEVESSTSSNTKNTSNASTQNEISHSAPLEKKISNKSISRTLHSAHLKDNQKITSPSNNQTSRVQKRSFRDIRDQYAIEDETIPIVEFDDTNPDPISDTEPFNRIVSICDTDLSRGSLNFIPKNNATSSSGPKNNGLVDNNRNLTVIIQEIDNIQRMNWKNFWLPNIFFHHEVDDFQGIRRIIKELGDQRLREPALFDVPVGNFHEILLMDVARYGLTKVLDLLLEKTKSYLNIGFVDQVGDTALSKASRYGHEGIMERLLRVPNIKLECEDLFGYSPLSLATLNNHYNCVNLLLTAKANVHHLDNRGNTPLSLASIHGHIGIGRLLIDFKSDVDSKNFGGYTCISWASLQGHTEMVELLLQQNVNIKSETPGKNHPSFEYAKQFNHHGIMRLLLDAGTDNIEESPESII